MCYNVFVKEERGNLTDTKLQKKFELHGRKNNV